MCGIIGIFGNNKPNERAQKSLELIVHRGGNTFELESFKNATLGANRLPIVDRENGKQPKSNEDKTIFAIQNGEVFNFKILRVELEKLGHSFSTDSDTEVLVHLYEEYRTDMVNKIDSEMFAFVIYDKKNNEVFAARDPLGVKPLYYAYDTSGQLYFSSELKQLVHFDDIIEVRDFPPGHYFFKGKFIQYAKLPISNELINEDEAVNLLERQLIEAVRKRVDTDLPVGVFLSGGVDSSLIMEIATRIHPNVTAIILGYPGSSDYEYALHLCKDRKYKYHIVRPDVDFEKELDNLIYHLETYEPLIIRQSFSLDICAREAQRLGLRVVLVGEGSDELFAGYNEFAGLSSEKINEGCKLLTESLHSGHLQRVDRMSMKHTVELRAPFFDKKIVNTAFRISGDLKIKHDNHRVTTKYIIRKLAIRFLPDYVAWRYKVPFSNGAGMNVGNNFASEDGDVAQAAIKKKVTPVDKELSDKYSVTTKEEQYYLSKFNEYKFTKLAGSENRLVVKDNLRNLEQGEDISLLVAEFDRLAIYFPVYFAAEKEFFKPHGINVNFIATGGDDKTYNSLVNNSAHIGLSDPMFAMFENKEGVKGEIIGELVNRIPCVAITINPSVKISDISDFSKYKIGTFQKYSTTNSVAKFLLPQNTDVIDLDYKELLNSLVNRSIDIAIVLPEQAFDIEALGGKIIYNFQDSFNSFLFSGFTIANILEKRFREPTNSFVMGVREATRYLFKSRDEGLKIFKRLFPELREPEKVFDYYLTVWSQTLKIEKEDYKNAHTVWKKNYPELLKNFVPYFRTRSIADPVLEKINLREFRRDFPFLEDKLRDLIIQSINNNTPLQLFGFWGAGSKDKPAEEDLKTLQHFKNFIDGITSILPRRPVVTWILADEHARSNQYSPQKYEPYLREMSKILKRQGYKVIYLNELWKEFKMTHGHINEVFSHQKNNWWNNVVVADLLEKQSKDRYQGKDKVVGAQHYYLMRMAEKEMLQNYFKDSVFFAYLDGRMQSIYPLLPTLYLYTEDRGVSDAPWFKKMKTI